MNNDLAPTYQRLFGHYWVFWFLKSNKYSVVELEFKTLLDIYFESYSIDEFISKLSSIDNRSNPIEIAQNIEIYLQNCNAVSKQSEEKKLKFKASNRKILKQYHIKNKSIQIYFDSELVKKTIHPAIAHLEVIKNHDTQTVFDIYLDGEFLCLFKNEKLVTSVPKRDYHLLQGKFFMQLLSFVHDKEEVDWMGTFHGSTISDGTNSILITGKSGKGKSTLCSLLAANGFELVADDVSPMLADDATIYHNPSAVSIKEGAFNTLQTLVDDFTDLPSTHFNKSKGVLKYIPFPNPKKDSYPCKSIIMVNYKKNSKTTLENISIKILLETLIPDSWLSPNPSHAKRFIEWLGSVNIYQLTYSDTDSVLLRLSGLFKELNN